MKNIKKEWVDKDASRLYADFVGYVAQRATAAKGRLATSH